jgi:class 3 adenylate cyclase
MSTSGENAWNGPRRPLAHPVAPGSKDSTPPPLWFNSVAITALTTRTPSLRRELGPHGARPQDPRHQPWCQTFFVQPPQTTYATASDGNQIAYQVLGDGPFDVVYLTGSMSNVDVRWEHAASAQFLERLASFSRLVIFDRRGIGVSDRLPPGVTLTWEEWSEDLQVVLDAVDSRRAVLFAVADGGAMAITFAAGHPERIEALVLFHSLGRRDFESEAEKVAVDELVASVQEELWGTPELVPFTVPSIEGDPAQSAWLAKYMRATMTPRARAALVRSQASAADVDFILPSLRVPTLVMSRTGYEPMPMESVRALARQIPDARLVELPGVDVWPQTQEADLILDEVEAFVTGVEPVPRHNRFLTTVLFSDIVDSTRLAASVGDREWQGRLEAHDRMVRNELDRFRGHEIKSTGDGFLVTFDGPGRAIHCARGIREGAQRLGIAVRIGLHTGEVERHGDDIAGIAVHIAARVSAAGDAGEILVSRTVTDLVAGSGMSFEDRGERELKGVPEPWRLFRVTGGAGW